VPRRVMRVIQIARPVAAALAVAVLATLSFADPAVLQRAIQNVAVVAGSIASILVPLATITAAGLGLSRAVAKPPAAPAAPAAADPTTARPRGDVAPLPSPSGTPSDRTYGGGLTLREILDAHDADMNRLDRRDREIVLLRAQLIAAEAEAAARTHTRRGDGRAQDDEDNAEIAEDT